MDECKPLGGGAHGAAINVQLSLEETYADIAPVRRSDAGPSAFVSIMRGCNNMCAFCIVVGRCRLTLTNPFQSAWK